MSCRGGGRGGGRACSNLAAEDNVVSARDLAFSGRSATRRRYIATRRRVANCSPPPPPTAANGRISPSAHTTSVVLNHKTTSMSDPLLRLSDQVDAQIPQFMVVATVRWLLALFRYPLLSLAHRSLSNKHKYIIALVYHRSHEWLSIWMTLAWLCLTAFVAIDFWQNSDDITQCMPHTTPRPMGIAAGVALVCFVCTTKMSVSVMCLVSFLCVKERNYFSGIAALLTTGVWINFELIAVPFFFACILAAVHATVCLCPSSAALSVACFCWMCLWTWGGVLSSLWSWTANIIR